MTGIAAVAICAAFTSCSKDTEFEQITPEKETEAQYNANFVAKYGQPASDQDWGFGATTRSAWVNRNQWGTYESEGKTDPQAYVTVPKNVTPTERELVYNYFNKQRVGAVNEYNINWYDYAISEVWKGTTEYYAWDQYNWTYAKGTDPVRGDLKNGAQKFLASDKMNHLQVRKGEGSIDANGNLIGDWEHANDFNNGNHNSSYGTIEGHTFMTNSGTLDFAYHNTLDSKYHNEYIIIPGALIDESLADYYYVGFDFVANDLYIQEDSGAPQHLNECADRDWYFTDWIVRISPGEYARSARVACEDLGTTDDFDFNDVVFDVAPVNYTDYPAWNNWQAYNVDYTLITVRAAGGTLPLYLEVGNVRKEVHELFGVSTKTMVNTKNGTVTLAPVQFKVDGQVTPSQVAVIVENAAKEIVLKAEVGKAPQKICVKTSFEWCNEREQIGDRYQNFPLWVKDKQVTWY